MSDKVTDEERARIVELLCAESSQGAVAREVGRSKQTISRIARAEGIDSDITSTKKAVAAKQRYDEAERRQLLNEGFDKARELLGRLADAGEFQKWTVGVGTLVDKVRLEDNQATDRSEVTHNQGVDLAEEFAKLDRELEG